MTLFIARNLSLTLYGQAFFIFLKKEYENRQYSTFLFLIKNDIMVMYEYFKDSVQLRQILFIKICHFLS